MKNYLRKIEIVIFKINDGVRQYAFSEKYTVTCNVQ